MTRTIDSKWLFGSAAALLGVVACSAPDETSVEVSAPLTQTQVGGDTSSGQTPPSPASAIGGLRFAGLSFTDQGAGAWTTVAASGGAVTWPSPYDLDPHWVHLAWAPFGSMPSAEAWKLATGDGYHMDVYVNGEKQQQGPDGNSGDYYVTPLSGDTFSCPTAVSCVGTSFNGAKLRSHPGTWTIKLVFWKTSTQPAVLRATSTTPTRVEATRVPVATATTTTTLIASTETATGTVYPHPQPISYFQQKLVPVFRHQNCSTCHALGDKQKLAAHHHGLITEGQIAIEAGVFGTELRCNSGCHKPMMDEVMNTLLPQVTFTETEWKVPGADNGFDWSEKTDKGICETLESYVPDSATLKQHFGADARIAWAVESGALPLGLSPHPTAPPHNFAVLQQILSIWIESGRRCPTQ